MTNAPRAVVLSMSLVLAAGELPAQTPLGTAFTYQGRLADGASPANGPFDIELRLFDAPSGGAAVGAAVVMDDVAVTEGLFTVSLDFGPAAFAGQARWLEIAVRAGASTGSYTTLSPRQELTPSPNAVFGSSAPWSGLIGVPPGFADGVDNDSGGDITSVTAGTGLTGGATSGDATLTVDTVSIQARVTGTCAPGQSIRTIDQAGTVVCETDDVGAGWGLTGNAGTNPATDFLGTTDAQPLVLRSNGTVAFRLSRGPVLPNVIGGSTQNAVTAGVDGATIAGGGGGTAAGANKVTDQYGVVGGGYGNVAGNDGGTATDAQWATVAGGIDNRASGTRSTVGGGTGNVASGGSALVAGGTLNTASGEDAVVAGGEANLASGTGAMVPGGHQNVAGGAESFAAGFRARVRDAAASGDGDGDEGAFVWADAAAPFAPFVSTGPNQFLVRAGGGVGINTNAPAFPLDVDGVIRSRTGGFRFPDGTTQTTAATGTGDVTAVNTPAGGGLAGGAASGAADLTLLTCPDTQILKRVAGSWTCVGDSTGTVTSITAGTGLTGGTITTIGTLGVSFSGTGAAATVARSDHDHAATYAATAHDHLGQTWTGAVATGLSVQVSGASARGLVGQTSGDNGTGVFGWSTAINGGYGVLGQNDAVGGRGVAGAANATTGLNYGVLGRAVSPSGVGVQGFADATAGFALGVAGQSLSSQGRAIYGVASATSGFTTGVYGLAHSTSATGVQGDVSATFGTTYGVQGVSASSAGTGVAGRNTSTTGFAIGVQGISSSTQGVGVFGAGQTGLMGISTLAFGYGVYGDSGPTTGQGKGVFGQSAATAGTGTYGYATASSGPANGVRGDSLSTNGSGVHGANFSDTGFGMGVSGVSFSTAGTGVSGLVLPNFSLSQGIGVRGEVLALSSTSYAVAGFAPTTAYAGFFSGRAHVTGTLSKGAGSFKIDHPLDPENKYLYHSFVESPDMKNIYDGLVTTDASGFATVEMPDWFGVLNRDFRYQLTVIGKGEWAQARVSEPLADGRFVIETSRPGIQVSWQVTGIRKDPFAEANRIPVEEDKPEAERGKYLHPEAWGQPEEAGVDHGLRTRSRPAPGDRPAPPGPS